jgi:hypothetical protein
MGPDEREWDWMRDKWKEVRGCKMSRDGRGRDRYTGLLQGH